MQELFYILSIFFILIFGYVAYQDYKTKLIFLWSFYILNIFGLLFLFYLDTGFAKYLLLFYFFIIILLDILEYFGKLPKFITETWMIGNTGVYDYWIYIFILVLFIDFLPYDFLKYYIGFTISLVLGGILGYLITKKRYDKQVPFFVYGFFIIFFMMIIIFILR